MLVCFIGMPADPTPVWQMVISKDLERLAMVNNIIHKDQVDVDINGDFLNLQCFSVSWQNIRLFSVTV